MKKPPCTPEIARAESQPALERARNSEFGSKKPKQKKNGLPKKTSRLDSSLPIPKGEKLSGTEHQ